MIKLVHQRKNELSMLNNPSEIVLNSLHCEPSQQNTQQTMPQQNKNYKSKPIFLLSPPPQMTITPQQYKCIQLARLVAHFMVSFSTQVLLIKKSVLITTFDF